MSLLQPSKTYKPFQYPWAVELAKKHEEIHWIEDEAELSEDVQDWKTKLKINFIKNSGKKTIKIKLERIGLNIERLN